MFIFLLLLYCFQGMKTTPSNSTQIGLSALRPSQQYAGRQKTLRLRSFRPILRPPPSNFATGRGCFHTLIAFVNGNFYFRFSFLLKLKNLICIWAKEEYLHVHFLDAQVIKQPKQFFQFYCTDQMTHELSFEATIPQGKISTIHIMKVSLGYHEAPKMFCFNIQL